MLYIDYKIVFVFLLLSVSGYGSIFAEGVRSHFIFQGPGIAAAGLGNSFTAAGNDLAVVYYNPSLLHKFPASYISGSNTFLYDTARYSFMGFSYNMDKSAFAITATQLYRDNIEVRQLITDSPTYTQNSKLLFAGVFSGELRRFKLSYGAAINYLQYNLYEYSDYGLGLDLSLSKRLFMFGNPMAKSLIIDSGINLKNIIQKPIKLISYKERLPFIFKAGLAARLTLFPRYSRDKDILSYDELLFVIDINRFESAFHNSLGLQYRLFDMFTFRTGYSDNLSFGAGLDWGSIKFDYAYSLKPFGGFHNIGFTYKFRERNITPVIIEFTKEFQTVFKKGYRIYDRYIREARKLASLKQFNDAIILLEKVIPLKPEDRQAKDLIRVYKNTILANESNKYITFGNNYQSNNKNIAAYKNFLNAFDSNPQNLSILNLLAGVYNSASVTEKTQLAQIKETYINNLAGRVREEIYKDNFSRAKDIFKKVEAFDPNAIIVATIKAEIKDKTELYLFRLVASGMEKVNNSIFVEAHEFFRLAYRLNPADSSIKDQMKITRKKFLKLKNYTLKDNLYSEKLYYLTAIEFATDESPLSLLNKLRSFNPLFEHLPLLEDSLRQRGIIR